MQTDCFTTLHSVRNDALLIRFDFVPYFLFFISYFDIGYWKFNIGHSVLKHI